MHLCKKNPCKLFPGQLYMRANKTAFKRPRLSQVMTESGRGDEVNIASPSRLNAISSKETPLVDSSKLVWPCNNSS